MVELSIVLMIAIFLFFVVLTNIAWRREERRRASLHVTEQQRLRREDRADEQTFSL